MLEIANLEDREYLKKVIEENLDFIVSNIDFENLKIKIHINSGLEDDYPRMFFILFTISKIYKSKILEIEKDKYLSFHQNLYKKSKDLFSENKILPSNFRIIQMYSLRFLNNLDADYESVLDDFSLSEFASIYSHPVSLYVYMSTFLECEKLRNDFEYSGSIYDNCLKVFEYLLFSSKKEEQPIFAFSEFSAWKNKDDEIPIFLFKKAEEVISARFKNDIVNYATSGILKCLEHFTIVDNKKNIEKVFGFLEQRNIKRFVNYLNPKFLKYNYVFTEDPKTQYICLDSNAHLIISLINLYEKKYVIQN